MQASVCEYLGRTTMPAGFIVDSMKMGRGVNEETFVEMLDAGGLMRIICVESAVRKTSNFPGRWHLFVSDPSRESWSQLELFAKKEPRAFKSVVGLIGFMLDKGFLVSAIPHIEGDCIEVGRDGVITHHHP